MMGVMNSQLYIITVQGLDRPGLVAEISKIFSDANVNIADIDRTVIRKLIAMYVIADFSKATKTIIQVKNDLFKKAKELKMKVSMEPYTIDEGLKRKENRKLILLTIIGKDKPGIVFAILVFIGLVFLVRREIDKEIDKMFEI